MRCTLSADKQPTSCSHSTTLLLADLSGTLLHRGAQVAVLQYKEEGTATPKILVKNSQATRAQQHHHLHHPQTAAAADPVLLAGPRMLNINTMQHDVHNTHSNKLLPDHVLFPLSPDATAPNWVRCHARQGRAHFWLCCVLVNAHQPDSQAV
jgi:hypothetical protein